MKLREWINRNSALVTVLSVFLLVYALIYLLTHAPRVVKPVTMAYYYDIETGQLFVGGVQEIPPISTPAGSMKNGMLAGVRANVFSCSGCDDEEGRYIGYLEMFTLEAQSAQLELLQMEMRGIQEDQPGPQDPAARVEQQASGAATGDNQPGATRPEDAEIQEAHLMEIVARGRLIATVDDLEKWYAIESEEGAQLASKALGRCPGNAYPMQCFPEE